jgi:ADP-heptose:LPS heptosyltransferase
LPDDVRDRARAFVARLSGTGPRVVLHPGTSRFGAFKRWDPGRFAALGDRLGRERNARILISWGPDEEELARSVRDRMAEPATLFPPPEGLLFLAATLAEVDLVIGADSGPMHLAALMDTPTLTLFGPKDPGVFKPMGRKSRAVWMNVECSPCQLRTCDHVTCMRSMMVDDVARPALALLAGWTEHPRAGKGEIPGPRA